MSRDLGPGSRDSGPVSRDSGPVSRGAVGDATPPAKHDVPLQTYRWGLFYAWFLWVVLYI